MQGRQLEMDSRPRHGDQTRFGRPAVARDRHPHRHHQPQRNRGHADRKQAVAPRIPRDRQRGQLCDRLHHRQMEQFASARPTAGDRRHLRPLGGGMGGPDPPRRSGDDDRLSQRRGARPESGIRQGVSHHPRVRPGRALGVGARPSDLRRSRPRCLDARHHPRHHRAQVEGE